MCASLLITSAQKNQTFDLYDFFGDARGRVKYLAANDCRRRAHDPHRQKKSPLTLRLRAESKP